MNLNDFIFGMFIGVIMSIASCIGIVGNYQYDVNRDGQVNLVDLSVLAAEINHRNSQ